MQEDLELDGGNPKILSWTIEFDKLNGLNIKDISETKNFFDFP